MPRSYGWGARLCEKNSKRKLGEPQGHNINSTCVKRKRGHQVEVSKEGFAKPLENPLGKKVGKKSELKQGKGLPSLLRVASVQTQ